VRAEQKATRERVAVFDQTSFSKYLMQGRDALAVLQQICANDIDVAPGRIVYTALLNRRGGFESDLTIVRLSETQFFIMTGTAQTTRDFAWISRAIGERFATLTDVTSAYSVISVMGPNAVPLLSRLSSDDLSEAAIPAGGTRDIDVGFATARAARVSYVGGPGFELTVPIEMAATLYDAIAAVGPEFGLADAGYYTIDALRIEAGRCAFAAELSGDDTPLEAGLMYAVRLAKPDFVGRDALLRQKQAGPRKLLTLFTLDDPAAFPWGGEGILRDGVPVGEVTSAGYSDRLGRAVAMGYVRGPGPIDRAYTLAGRYTIDISGEAFSATPCARPPFAG
jgi:4-methylaminobutanoate oxidase (formaldehyde-forming)